MRSCWYRLRRQRTAREQQEQHSEPDSREQASFRDDAVGSCEIAADTEGEGLGKILPHEALAEDLPAVIGGRLNPDWVWTASMLLAHRVDRLRLAGNGVVPAQAAFAIRAIIRRMLGGPVGEGIK